MQITQISQQSADTDPTLQDRLQKCHIETTAILPKKKSPIKH